ncbi:esterase/lipase family protein [Thalassoroseus pseudoceratinae]|uniref:esterase/lipase family protein n=1 Tax=Thalassoroseus pseudoceratinae TaxID=2713176 RepID=UPI00141E5F81|nr:alpha/beta fold hydrolase [Thalassoroseus pseudoceratinae]
MLRILTTLIVVLLGGAFGAASEPHSTTQPSLLMKTMGGRQFWGDVAFQSGWRIQQHIITKHYRLLDPDDFRHASGTLEECRAKLDEVRKSRSIPPMKGKAALLIHGLIRSSKSFERMRKALRDAGYTVVVFDYPSTRAEVKVAAEFLRQVIASLEGIEQIDIVTHSMGGIVVRQYLQNEPDDRLHRMVMIGTPNLGANIAKTFKRNIAFRLIFGPSGQQLATDSKYVDSLPTPDFPFGVIAGARGKPQGFNPLLPGDDDGVVSVASTRLPGASDFLEVCCLHTFLLRDDTAIEATLEFFQSGRFRKTGETQPIPRPAVNVEAE